jgi:hypothetical protein
MQGLRQDELCVRQGRDVQLRQQLRLREEGVGGTNIRARPRRGSLRGRAFRKDYSTAKPCNATGTGMHCGAGNWNWPTRILQVLVLVAG